MKKILKTFFTAILLTFGVTGLSQAGEVSVLLDKLVEKGYLTANEAKIIEQETKTQVTKEVVQKTSYALPDWVQSIKISGDLRLRYQYEDTENALASRSRGRTRFRMGFEMNPTNKLKVGAGLASGGTDPRSTNVTWENTFERPDIRLDTAFVEYVAAPWAKVVAGKFVFTDYLWQTTDMLWDTDINPYGASANFTKPLTSTVDGFVNAGSWIIDENGATKAPDPYMLYVQGGLGYAGDKFDAKVAGIYYAFNGVKGFDLDNELNTNSQVGNAADAGLKFDYDSGGLSAVVGAKKLLGGLPFNIDERIAVFADYIYNPDPSEQNIGWGSGMVWGNAKVAERKQWQMKYQYVYLGKDAFPDTFPDSDRLGGRTDVKSHEVIFTYGLLKNLTFGVDYYQSERIKASKNAETIVQGDLTVKF